MIPSEEAASKVRRLPGLRTGSVRVIPYGVDVDLYAAPEDGKRERLRGEQFGVPATAEVLCCVGRLNPEKRIDLAIRAVPLLVERGHDVHLLIAGNGPLRGDLGALGEHGVGGRVHFLGRVSPPRKVYTAADLTLFPSDAGSETFGSVVAESALCGTPVLRSRTEGHGVQIRDGETGFLCEPGDLHDLVRCAASALGDPERLREAGRGAAAHCAKEFPVERTVDAYFRIDEDAFGAATASHPAGDGRRETGNA